MSLKAMSWAIEQSCGGPSTKVTLWSIANYVNKESWCGYVSQKTLSKETEQSPDSVQRRIPELVDRGLLIRIPLRYDGRKSVDFFILQPSPYFGKPLVEIEPHLPRGFEIDPKFAATYVAADCGSAPLPQTLPQPAENVTALVRQHEPLREPREPEEERDARASEREAEPAPASPPQPEPVAGLTVDHAWRLILKSWPDIALQSEALARKQLEALSPSDRKLAVERIPVFLAFHKEKLGKAKLPFLHNYLGERTRWTTLPADKTAAGNAADPGIVPAWSRAWWWLFFGFVRRSGGRLANLNSGESQFLAKRLGLARMSIGWKVGPSRFAEIELAAKAFVQIPVDGPAWNAWDGFIGRDYLAGLPRPDKVGWIYVPSEYPPDDRAREDEIRNEAAEIMGAEG